MGQTGEYDPRKLENWSETEVSRAIGDTVEGESTDRDFLQTKRTEKDARTDDTRGHMATVVNYIKRPLSQAAKDEVNKSDWRYALMKTAA